MLVGAAAVMLGAAGVAVWMLPRWTDQPADSNDTLWDDDLTEIMPALRPEPLPDVVVDGWSREDGWCPLAELSRIEREAAQMDNEAWRQWMDTRWVQSMTRDLDVLPILAELATTRPLELTGAIR